MPRSYGKEFAVRMIVLSVILAGIGFAAYYDKVVLPKKQANKINEVWGLMTSEQADSVGIKQTDVAATFGFAPVETFDDKENDLLVETYRFKRVFPFATNDELKIVYRDGSMIKILQNKDYNPSTIEAPGQYYQPPKEERIPVGMGGGGIPGNAPQK